MQITEFDFAGWQARMNFTAQQAAQALDISASKFLKMKREGKDRKLYAWACYGIERAEQDQKAK
jgi:hypothetical protein